MSVMNLPPSTLAWIVRVGGGPIAAISRLEGGVQAETHAVDLSLPGGVTRHLVLRRFDTKDAGPARREAAHLAGLLGSGLPVAELVAADPEAKETDLPATLQTRLPGTGNLDPTFALARLDQLAAVLARIHLVPYQRVRQLSDNTSRAMKYIAGDAPPAVAAEPGGASLWQQARELSRELTREQPVLLHADFHIGNVVWYEGRLSGVVDWSSAGVGARARDVAYCRMDLALVFGGDAPDRFLAAYERVSAGRLKNRAFWDVYMATLALTSSTTWIPGWWGLGRTDLTAEVIRTRVRAFVASVAQV